MQPETKDAQAEPREKPAGIKLLLWGLQSPINVGMLLRVAESYRVTVGIFGSVRLLNDLMAMQTVSDFACGALQRAGFTSFEHESEIDDWRGEGRIVATSIDPDATTVRDFHFLPGDVVVLGNEYDGLPEEVAASADCRVFIPMAGVWTPKPRSARPIDPNRKAPVARDGQPNLNVAVAGAIICYEAYLQVGIESIFISYTKKDRVWAHWIGVTLRENGYKPLIHEWSVGGGTDWVAWIDQNIDEADRHLCVCSDEYLKAPYSKSERRAFYSRDPEGRGSFLLVEVEEVTRWPATLEGLKRLSLVGLTPDEAERELLAFLLPPNRPLTRPPFPGSPKSPPSSKLRKRKKT